VTQVFENFPLPLFPPPAFPENHSGGVSLFGTRLPFPPAPFPSKPVSLTPPPTPLYVSFSPRACVVL